MWIAGARMWLGVSPASCTMYSPRSVSTRAMPLASSASLRPISSAIMLLLLVTERAPALAAKAQHDRARLGGVARPVDLAALLEHALLERLEVEVEMGERVVLDRLGGIAQRLELGQPCRGGAALLLEAGPGEAERLPAASDRPAPDGRCP